MASVAVELQTVKLTTDARGQVWFLDGQRLPQATHQTVSEFLSTNRVALDRELRVPGLARNATLLTSLYRAVQLGTYARLEVCSPLCCFAQEQREDPEVLLLAARSFDPPSSVGGWRRFDHHDLYSYLLAERYYQGGAPDPQTTLFETMSHAAYPALVFISHLNCLHLARLLGLIVDPRWFLDPTAPDQSNKLPQFLGLDPRAQAGKQSSATRIERNRLVLSCWKNEEPPDPQHIRPDQFLWRTWYAKGGGLRGDLATSKRFIEYLRQVWLRAVCRGGLASEVFVPQLFFGAEHTTDAAAFLAHLGPC